MMVCMARAAAHEPDDARRRVERYRASSAPHGLRARLGRAFLEARAKMMVARTIAIDDAVRAAASPQVVILGARA